MSAGLWLPRIVPQGTNRSTWTWGAALLLLPLLAACSPSPGLEIGFSQANVWTAEIRPDMSAIQPIRAFVLQHAPYKQVEPRTGAPNKEIGRTPGSACEVIRFLAALARRDRFDTEAIDKANELAGWVISLQDTRSASPTYGGVPSTPDLPEPASRYFYAIDAGFCGAAMFELHDLTKDERYRQAGLRFADFLVHMQSGRGRPYARSSGAPDGFCEFIVNAGPEPAWNCDRHVKTLSALPVLRRATALSGKAHYEEAAKSARELLVEGLTGAWEYAKAAQLAQCRDSTCPKAWRRVAGPNGERDYFVYGDTLAYALRGLFEYEGPSPTVRMLYDRFAGYSGKDSKTRQYDGRIAFAGYMRPASASPDPFSAYYDVVTLGILHGLRRAVRPDHYAIADKVLRSRLVSAAQLSWKTEFDLSLPKGEFVDLTTLANLGEALVLPAATAR